MLRHKTPLSSSCEITKRPEAENAKSKRSPLEVRKQKKTLIVAVKEKLRDELMNTVIYDIAF